MQENQPNDIEILKVKKKKRSTSQKKKTNTSKNTQRSNNKYDNNNNISSKNNINLNLNKRKISSNNEDNLFQYSALEPLKSTLDTIQEVIIKQESDILEAVTGCQEPNNYHIYGKISNDEKCYIFKCKEYSSCCMRFCCPVNCRGLVMKIKLAFDENENENNPEDEYNNSLLFIEKNFKCPFCNCVRPEMKIYLTETNTLLGTIEQAFSCCDPIFKVFDKDGKYIYYIESDCCQCGFMCRNNCFGKTDECIFFIYNVNDKANPIGEINKKGAVSLLAIADNYSVIFPRNATFEEKILLTIAGVMIDYQYFEKNTNTVR